MKTKDRAKLVEEIIRLAYSSLESHLHYTHRASAEGKTFHRACVKDYARIIKAASLLY